MTEACKHNSVMVYTIEEVNQSYDFEAKEWTSLSENGEVFGVTQAKCDDCGEDLRKPLAESLGRPVYDTTFSQEQGWNLHKGGQE